jgi:hypothetical protein
MVTKEVITKHMQDMIDEIYPVAERTVKAGEELPPLLFLFFHTKEGIEPRHVPGAEIFFRNNNMKDKLPGFIRFVRDELRSADAPEEVRGDEMVGIMLISDIYRADEKMVDGKKPNIEDLTPPSQRPDRTEALMFSCHIKGHAFMKIYPYTRGEQIVFGEPETIDSGEREGRFANLFPD